MKRNRLFLLAVMVTAFSTVMLPTAQAYLDPGSGSFIFQAVIAGALGIGVTLKVFWGRIAAFFSGVFSKNSSGSSSTEE
jgi:hypothetical protein